MLCPNGYDQGSLGSPAAHPTSANLHPSAPLPAAHLTISVLAPEKSARNGGFNGKINHSLVICYIAIENGHRNSELSLKQNGYFPYAIPMLVYPEGINETFSVSMFDYRIKLAKRACDHRVTDDDSTKCPYLRSE